jgi:hypothetical protein
MEHWKGSNVSISEKDSEGKEKRILYGTVPSGTWLYITAGESKGSIALYG